MYLSFFQDYLYIMKSFKSWTFDIYIKWIWISTAYYIVYHIS